MNGKHVSSLGLLSDAHDNSCTGKSAASSEEIWASALKSRIYQYFNSFWRRPLSPLSGKTDPIQVHPLGSCNQTLSVCRVKANEEKHHEGGSASASSLRSQAVKRNKLHVLGKGSCCIIPFLLQKDMFTEGKNELQWGTHTASWDDSTSGAVAMNRVSEIIIMTILTDGSGAGSVPTANQTQAIEWPTLQIQQSSR